MITPSVKHQLPHIPLFGITITPASTSPRTRPSHVKAVGRSFRPSATNTVGAVLPARRMFLPASRPSADLNILKIIIQSRAGGMCPLKPIWRDRPRTSVSAKRGGCGSASRPPTYRGFGRGINPEGLCSVITALPGAFRSMSGGLFRMVRMMVAGGVTSRLSRFLTDHRSGCASLFATTLNRTPGT